MKLLCVVALLLLANPHKFTDERKAEWSLNQLIADSSKVIFITHGFKSCEDCYIEISDFLTKINSKEQISIYWLSENVKRVADKMQKKRQLVAKISKEDLVMYFDDEDNSFLHTNEINISPSLIIYNGGKQKTIPYQELFSEDGIITRKTKEIIDFMQ